MRKLTVNISYALVLVITGLLAVAFFMPIIVTFTNSFMTPFEITNRYTITITPGNIAYRLPVFPQIHFVRITLIPGMVTVRQYLNLFVHVGYLNALWNSMIIAIPAVLSQLVISAPAAYAFEFGKWQHKEKIFFVYILIMLMPLPVLLVPQFVIATHLGISESVLAVIIPAAFTPFGVFLLRQFMKTLSSELIEAAKIDGAGQLRILAFIIIPLMKPAIAALAVLVFIDFWNVVEQAIVFITDPGSLPLSVFLPMLAGDNSIIFAASTFFMFPAMLVLLHGQEYLTEGMRIAGLK